MLGELRPGPHPQRWSLLLSTTRYQSSRRTHAQTPGRAYGRGTLGQGHWPCQGPGFWTTKTVVVPFVKGTDCLVDPPPGDTFVALSFPILQTDDNGDLKLRGGEDWRRSHHNTTVAATEISPTSHSASWRTVGRCSSSATICSMHIVNGRSGMHLPPDCRRHNPVVPQRHVLRRSGVRVAFQSGGRRLADPATRHAAHRRRTLRRRLQRRRVLEAAQSAFSAFADFFALLGLRTKESKAQRRRRRTSSRASTLWWRRPRSSSPPRNVALPESQPTSRRHWNTTPFPAFGRVGQAATKPVHSRAADTSARAVPTLCQGLRAALRALVAILANLRLKEIPLNQADATPVLYADGFFLDGERRVKAGYVNDERTSPSAHRRHG